MKIQKYSKVSLVLATVTFLLLISAKTNPTFATYGSDVILGVTTPEVHETVDAGFADMLPLITSVTAISGLITTSILLKKIK
jgi:hypothetical protein